MTLKPVFASNNGESLTRMQEILSADVLKMIESYARVPETIREIPPEILTELIEMHVLKEYGGLVRLDTAVFLENDIRCILDATTLLVQELCQKILKHAPAFHKIPPEMTLFLGGMCGLVQGLGAALRQKNIGVEWWNYPGKYAQSKVDFDEVCDAYIAIGPDFLNKTILRGERYTAVFMGPGGDNFEALSFPLWSSPSSKAYARSLNRYLVDAYALLVSGRMASDALCAAAETAKMYKEGKLRSAVITNQIVQEYGKDVQAIIDTVTDFYFGKLDTLDSLLRATTPGRQGAPPAVLWLNLFRYIRKLTARELYAGGFFTDTLPTEGTITVFYENDSELIGQLFK